MNINSETCYRHGTLSERIAAIVGGTVTGVTSTASLSLTSTAGVVSGNVLAVVNNGSEGGVLKVKTLLINDWDMSTASGTTTVSVAHGLTRSTIRMVDVQIRNDADTIQYPISYVLSTIAEGTYSLDATNVVMTRIVIGGLFDSANFNATSYNRGWITVWYL